MEQTNKINSTAQHYIDHIAKACERIKPLVVMRTITYNHEKYLADALDGFLMQQTTFPTIAIVHDDASTDGTAEVLRQYAEKYPDKIFPIFEKENQYSKRDGSLRNIMNVAVEATGAIYIAFCEGDDYWTDAQKLQKQVDFLESHPEYSMCCHAMKALQIDGNSFCNEIISANKDIDVKKIYNGEIATGTIVMRQIILKSDIYKSLSGIRSVMFGDFQLFMSCRQIGKIWMFGDIMSVYRMSTTGSQSAFRNNVQRYIDNHKEIIKTIGKKEYDQYFRKHMANVFICNILNDWRQKRLDTRGYLPLFVAAPIECTQKLIYLLKVMINKVRLCNLLKTPIVR